MLTHLGENITDGAEAQEVTKHYLDVLDQIRNASLPAEVSVKLTQLGLDLDQEFCFANLAKLIEHTPRKKLYGSISSKVPMWTSRWNSIVARARHTRMWESACRPISIARKKISIR